MKLRYCIGWIALLIGLMGCHSQKRGMGVPARNVNAVDILTTSRQNFEHIDRLWIKRYSGELNFREQTQKIKGHIRIVKDSIIILTMGSSIGIEAARMYLTTDSVTIINRLSNTYYTEPAEKIKAELGEFMDYYIIQDMLLLHYEGLTGGLEKKLKRSELKMGNHTGCIQNVDEQVYQKQLGNGMLLKTVCFNDAGKAIKQLEFLGPGVQKYTSVIFETGQDTSGIHILKELDIQVVESDKKTTSLKIEIYRTNVNTIFPTKLSIGKKYTRVSRVQLL